MEEINFIVIGNGYDLSLGMDTKFSSFMKTQIDEEYVKNFKKENNDFFVRRSLYNKYHGKFKSIYKKFENIFDDIETWNELESIIDSIYREKNEEDYEEEGYEVPMYGIEYDDFVQGLKIDDRYSKIEPNLEEEFMLTFSEKFKVWIGTQKIEIPNKIKYVDSYNSNDIILNLNFTDTVPSKYKNHFKVHKIDDEEDYHYIGPYSRKSENEDIQANLDMITGKILNLQKQNININKVYIYGANMHSEEIVDMHIIKFINSLHDFSNPELCYIGLNLKEKDKKRIMERIIGKKSFIDAIKNP